METVEMDLMQAQIGSLATDVSRLEAKVGAKANNIALDSPDIFATAVDTALTNVITTILTTPGVTYNSTETDVNDATAEDFNKIMATVNDVIEGASPTINISIGGQSMAFKVIQAEIAENSRYEYTMMQTPVLISGSHFVIFITTRYYPGTPKASVLVGAHLIN